jgi:Rha family phage regulatory protein
MNKNLVYTEKGKVFCTSLDIAREFNIMHKHILEKINNLTDDIPSVKNQFIESEFTNERNRKYPMFVMNRDGYMTLVMELNAKSKESRILLSEKKQLFIQAFNKMEKLILQQQLNKNNLEWSKSREQGKQIRLELTDEVKNFVDYAKNQGSKNAERYYANITKMEYKALGFIEQSKPKIRDTLDLMQLHQLILADDLCRKQLNKYMLENLHYKEIYILIKQDIENFSKVLYLKQD